MVLLLFQFSNGKWVVKNVTNEQTQMSAGTEDYYGYTYTTTTDYTTEYVDTDQVNFQKCIDKGGELLGHLKKICIQYEHKDDMQSQNNWEIRGMDGKTELIIKIRNLQVIQIDIHSITVSMKMEVEWWEYRLDMDTNELQITVQSH